ncbi:MAG: penicillin-binding protein activator [Myxococcales bacterium]|nr:penicillin-binding protein activator [Myxococcales bacterium]
MRLSLLFVSCTLVLATLGGGCPRGAAEVSTLPLITTDDPAAEAALRSARDLVDAGQLREGETRYREFLRDFASDPLAPVARVELGRLLLAGGRAIDARPLFREVTAHSDARLAERARLYEGAALQMLGQSAEAIPLFEPLVGRTVDPEETQLLLESLAAARENVGDQPGAIEALDALLRESIPVEARDAARARLSALVAALPVAALYALAERLPHEGEAWPEVARRALREAFAAGELHRVRALTAALRESRVPLDRDLQSMALRAERTGRVDPQAIGAILPLSGRGREVGQLALQGLMLASELPGEGPQTGGPRLHFRDAAGDPEAAVRAVDDLVTLHQVVAIVGPIDARVARAAARRAQELGVPILTLAPDATLTRTGDLVFRYFPTPREEARELVGEARRRGARRVAAFFPDHAYGRSMRDAFREACQAEGLEWAGEVTYPAGATSFREPIEALRALRFDALAIPDQARALTLVAPALAAAGALSVDGQPGPRVLAPSVALDEQLVRTTGRYLQGALFSLPFHAGALDGPPRQLQDAFRARFQRAPDVYAAAAYDALRLVRDAARGLPETEAARPMLAERLARGGARPTATALGGFTPARGPSHGTQVFELRGAALLAAD